MDDRSSNAKAMAWVTRITTVSFMMVLPVLGGYYVDTWLGTEVLFMFLGVVLGLVCGFWHLMKMVALENASESPGDSENDSTTGT